MNYLYIVLIIIIIIIINNVSLIKENFSGFHKVNVIIRYIRRCNDAINSIKSGLLNAADKIIPNKHDEKCKQHYECNDKCVCEKNKCKCIQKII